MIYTIRINNKDLELPQSKDNWTDEFIKDCQKKKIDYCVFKTKHGRVAMTLKQYSKLNVLKLKKLGILGGK